MIAVDTSAIVAIFRSEQDSHLLLQKLALAGEGVMSAGNILDLQLVLHDRDIADWNDIEDFLENHNVALRPFDERQLQIAREAAVRYGKGRHKARLNFGDCFAYALAKSEDIPLLCTGSDFAETDVAVA
jgi:ribonuclease VapC